jgi:hypothetical protein
VSFLPGGLPAYWTGVISCQRGSPHAPEADAAARDLQLGGFANRPDLQAEHLAAKRLKPDGRVISGLNQLAAQLGQAGGLEPLAEVIVADDFGANRDTWRGGHGWQVCQRAGKAFGLNASP